MHKFWAYPSTYVACLIWGATGFMAQPSFASFLVHFLLAPPLILAALWLAHWEGRSEGRATNVKT